MTEASARARAATGNNRTAISWGFLAVVALVLLLALAAGAAISAAPAVGETSPRYERLWDKLGDRHKRWARRTARCESGPDRNAHSPGRRYHGAYQFMLPTWRNAPKSPGGDPHRYSRKTQAVVAVYLKKQDGAKTHWPSCG